MLKQFSELSKLESTIQMELVETISKDKVAVEGRIWLSHVIGGFRLWWWVQSWISWGLRQEQDTPCGVSKSTIMSEINGRKDAFRRHLG